MHNAITHAYPDREGVIRIAITTFSHGIRIDIRDWGMPMAKSKFVAAASGKTSKTGFDHVRKLVDDFHYKNLEKRGKFLR